MATRLNHDNILLLEQPLLKVPTDSIRSSLRATQRALESGLVPLKASITDLHSKSSKWHSGDGDGVDAQKAEALKAIDVMLAKANAVKRKLQETHENQQTGTQATLNRLQARLQHLQDLHDAETPNDDSYKKFSKLRLDRQLIDYMLRSGHETSARKLSQDLQLEALVDAPLFSEIARIDGTLRVRSCTEALAWCKENTVHLKKLNSTLEFNLRYQEFVELVRARKLAEAIAYCRKQLIVWKDDQFASIKQGMALLAFEPSTKCPPYAQLYDPVRWETLRVKFRNAVFELHSIPAQPPLHVSLSVGLAAFKLLACYGHYVPESTTAHPPLVIESDEGDGDVGDDDEEEDDDVDMASSFVATLPVPSRSTLNASKLHPSKSTDCPVCDHKGLGVLAVECPWSHHVNSTIVCQLTGKVVEAGEGLATLPNGRVYSLEGLEAMAAKTDGTITCPRTGEVYTLDDLRRVFIS